MRKNFLITAITSFSLLTSQGRANDAIPTVFDYQLLRIPCSIYLANMDKNNDIENHILNWAHGYWSALDMIAFKKIGHSLFPQTDNSREDSVNAERQTKDVFTNICKENPDMSVVIAAIDTMTYIS